MSLPPPSHADPVKFWLPDPQDFAVEQERQRHIDALYHFGEYAMFVLMWHPEDHERGLVQRCPTCFTSYGKTAEVYGQSAHNKCPDCFGTSFEGGYRARIVRPAIVDVSEPAHRTSERGETTRANASVQTTHDFDLKVGDHILRADGSRWRIETLSTNHLQTGFYANTVARDVLGWNFGQCILEDEKSVAYLIPPTPAEVIAALDVTRTRTPESFAEMEDIRGYLL